MCHPNDHVPLVISVFSATSSPQTAAWGKGRGGGRSTFGFHFVTALLMISHGSASFAPTVPVLGQQFSDNKKNVLETCILLRKSCSIFMAILPSCWMNFPQRLCILHVAKTLVATPDSGPIHLVRHTHAHLIFTWSLDRDPNKLQLKLWNFYPLHLNVKLWSL